LVAMVHLLRWLSYYDIEGADEAAWDVLWARRGCVRRLAAVADAAADDASAGRAEGEPRHDSDFQRDVDWLLEIIETVGERKAGEDGDNGDNDDEDDDARFAGTLCATVCVTREAYLATGKGSMSIGTDDYGKMMPDNKPRTREAMAEAAEGAAAEGNLDEAALERLRLKYIEKLEERADRLRWSSAEIGTQGWHGASGTKSWYGVSPGAPDVMYVEYPIDDQAGFGPGDVGHDAFLKTKNFGLLAVPRDVARRLRASKDAAEAEGRVAAAAAAGSGSGAATPGSRCEHCGAGAGSSVKLRKCSKCKMAWYCGRDCQVATWRTHKQECADLQAGWTT
jgi:hypothetical protein